MRGHADCLVTLPPSPQRSSKLPVDKRRRRHRANRATSPEAPRGGSTSSHLSAPSGIDMGTTAPKDPDAPGMGPVVSAAKEEYDEEFPNLPPAPAPSDTSTPTSCPAGRDRGRPTKGEEAQGSRSSPAEMTWSQERSCNAVGDSNAKNALGPADEAAEAASSQSTLAAGGSPVLKSRPRRRAGGLDLEDSSSDSWGYLRLQGRSTGQSGAETKKKQLRKRGTKHGPSQDLVLPRRHTGSGQSGVSFGDDLDELSDRGDLDSSSDDDVVVEGGGQSLRRRRRRGWRVRLAGLNTPLHRRLQTLVVLMHCLLMGLLFTLFCLWCTMPWLWPVLGSYMVYVRLSTSGTDGRDTFRNEAFRRSRIWRYFADYFPAALHKTAELPPTRKYIFCVHPHGIISHGAFAAFATDALGFSDKFPGVTNHLLTLNGNFKTPLYREYLLALGMQSVSRESIVNLLTRGGTDGEGMGRAVSIVVGGAREALEGQPRTMRLIMSRKGFCRMALRTGADLVPVLVFGENDLYSQWSERDHPRFRRLQMRALAWMGFSVPVLRGRGVFNYDFGILPRRRSLNVVVGAPIPVEQLRTGTGASRRDPDQETDALHALYTRELKQLYEDHKDVHFVDRKEEMEFIE